MKNKQNAENKSGKKGANGAVNTVKQRALSVLEGSKNEYVSGEALAEKLGVSRAAVWKAVDSLRTDGCGIEAVTNRGYRLINTGDRLDSEEIKRQLRGKAKAIRVETVGTVSSTNALLRERAASGEQEGLFVAAASQTAGRGRLGRSFFSPENTGLYMSILLRPRLTAEESALITTVAAVSLCEAIEKVTSEHPLIKWVNDIFLNGKKIAGILTEGSLGLESGTLDYAVLGVGINLYSPKGGFPAQLRDIAGSLCETETENLRNRLAAEFLNSFMGCYSDISDRSFADGYRKRCFVLGEEINVISPEETYSARAVTTDDDCRLVIELPSGEQKKLSSGEISIRISG